MSKDKELAGDRYQNDLGRFAACSHAAYKLGKGFIGPFGAERTHVEGAAQAFVADAADPS